jgi:hypothetical protein
MQTMLSIDIALLRSARIMVRECLSLMTPTRIFRGVCQQAVTLT